MSKELADREVSNWWEAAMRLGEQLGSDGPRGYYELTPTQWLKWAESQLPAIAALRSEPVAVEWEVAMRNLVFAARTTGGTAGPDEHLKLCCDDCEEVLASAPSRESRTDECVINPVMSCVCNRGTKSCIISHAKEQ